MFLSIWILLQAFSVAQAEETEEPQIEAGELYLMARSLPQGQFTIRPMTSSTIGLTSNIDAHVSLLPLMSSLDADLELSLIQTD